MPLVQFGDHERVSSPVSHMGFDSVEGCICYWCALESFGWLCCCIFYFGPCVLECKMHLVGRLGENGLVVGASPDGNHELGMDHRSSGFNPAHLRDMHHEWTKARWYGWYLEIRK